MTVIIVDIFDINLNHFEEAKDQISATEQHEIDMTVIVNDELSRDSHQSNNESSDSDKSEENNVSESEDSENSEQSCED